MKVKRVVSTSAELEKKMSEANAHSITWSSLWQATSEKDLTRYKKMMQYQEIAQQYHTRLQKRSQKDPEIRFKQIYDDIMRVTNEYVAKHNPHTMHPDRKASILRLRRYSESMLHHKTLPIQRKLIDISAFLLKELNETEISHNNNCFSNQFTTSSLANAYMSIFEENNIDLNNDLLQRTAAEFQPDIEPSGCCLPLRFI